MWTRGSLVALLCCLAGTFSYVGACDWHPVARSVQPERVLDGPARIEMLLDANGRYVLVTRFDGDQRSLSIVDWKNHKACALPDNVARFERPLSAPRGRAHKALFLMPVATRTDSDQQLLQFADEHCKLLDSFGVYDTSLGRPLADDDGRELFLFGDGSGDLSLADPWQGETTLIAHHVGRVSTTQDPETGAQAVWLLEDGKLTRRTLDGMLLDSLGSHVTDFNQTNYDGLRVAFVDGGDLYEATGAELKPVLIAQDACSPAYRNGFLDLYQPCSDRQLVRVLLFSGKVKEFDPGVYASFDDDSGYTFEFARDEDHVTHLFAEPPGRERTEITPPFLGKPLVIDPNHVAGLIDDGDGGRTFAIWSPNAELQRVFTKVAELSPFIDIRSSSYLWLMHHDVVDGFGTLSVFTERTLTLQTVATRCPLHAPLGDPNAPTHGYSFESLSALPEPLLIHVTDGEPLESEPKLFRGTLRARLLSGELGSTIGEDVSSYAVVSTPLPGILYGVEEGNGPGLWFAAL